MFLPTCAGLSLGEYTALTFAEAFSVEDALKLIEVRSRAMQEASNRERGTMLSVFGVEKAALQAECDKVRAATGCVVGIGNELFPKCFVVSGHAAAVHTVEKSFENRAKKMTYLPVSGAFHSELMLSAVEPLRQTLNTVHISLPRIAVYSNTLARPYSSVDEIREQLSLQISQPVRWEDSIRTLLEAGVTEFVECGPGEQLTTMLKRIDSKAGRHCLATNI
eukprot:m.162427 g.162427  ORF g.162427 m.162427 type:complete len:221 (-) comp21004_c0_seq3:48-710(-)